MGGGKRDTDPTRPIFVTGVHTPSREGGTASLRRVFLRFFFLPHPCLVVVLSG